MDNKQFFHADMKAVKQTEKGTLVRGYASTPTQDRHSDVVEPDAFRKTIGGNFAKNPIVLFQHKTDRPIGTVKQMNIDPQGLNVEILVVDKEIEPKIQAGILKTLSIGYNPTKVEFRDRDGELIDPNTPEGKERIWFEKGVKRIIKELELFEVSVVTIPANPDATFAPKLFSLAKSVKNFFALQKKEFLSNNNINAMKKDIDLNTKDDENVENEPENVETPAEEPGDASEDTNESPADETSGEDEGGETDAEASDEEANDEGGDDDEADDEAESEDAESDDEEADEEDDAEADESEDEEDEDAEEGDESDESEEGDDEAESDEDAESEDAEGDDAEGEDEGEKSLKIDPELVTAENMVELSKKVNTLEAKNKELSEANKRLAKRATDAEAELAKTPVKKALSSVATGIKGVKEKGDPTKEQKKEDSKKGFKKSFFKGA
jgi:HK97 family phage prohead protease